MNEIERFGWTRLNILRMTWCEVQIREKVSFPGGIQKGDPHKRNPCAPKFEERTLEETSRQEEYARQSMARNIYKLKAEDEATFFSLVNKSTGSVKEQESLCMWLIRELQCTC